jgi:RHS repeat-associated protein
VESSAGVSPAGRVREQWTYLPDGRWVEHVVSTNDGSAYYTTYTNRYVWDGNLLLAVLNHTNGLVMSFLRGLDLSGTMGGAGGAGGLVAVCCPPNGTHFAAYDGNGNVSALVAAADGIVSADYAYGPFGEVLRATGPMAKANSVRFSTQYANDVTGELKYLYRDYSSSLERWLSRDPAGEQGGDNLYVTVGNSPISKVDVNGLLWKWPWQKNACKCCCCAEDIKIQNIVPLPESGFALGHFFDTVITLKYVVHKEEKDCQLVWLERTNVGYTPRMRRRNNVWYDMTQDPDTEHTFDHSWGARKKPCPGSETVLDEDKAAYSKFLRPHRRILEFHIIVYSAPGCPCAKPSREITAKQTLDSTTDPPTQEFETPAP